MNNILETIDTDRITGKSSGNLWIAGLVVLALAGALAAFMKRRGSDDSQPASSGDPQDNDTKPAADVMGAQRRPPVNTTV